MKHEKGDILSDKVLSTANAICITTNGITKNNGHAVMGAGLAKQAALKWPNLPIDLGYCLRNYGNNVYLIGREKDCHILSFPTKIHWKNASSLNLIESSARELAKLANAWKWSKVFLPPVGCGLGGLLMKDVKPVLEKYLDDRFIIINF
jgi:hypothetical protein